MRALRWVTRVWGALLLSGLLWWTFYPPGRPDAIGADELLTILAERAFRYFLDHQDVQTGLVSDSSQWGPASMAATGFCLAALVIGAERGWIDADEARSRALLTINTCRRLARSNDMRCNKWGFLYHFVDRRTGRRFVDRSWRSEVSIVDTALLVAGALCAGEYFQGEVQEAAHDLYSLVQWDKFLDESRGLFYGAWQPETGFTPWHWDYYSDEVLLISLLAVGSPTYPVDPGIFYTWKRVPVTVGERTFIRSWPGGLFTYQYAHLWLDLKGLKDREGVDWWENSRLATLADRDLCIKYSVQFRSYGENGWGVTPCFHPRGMKGYEGRLSLLAEGGVEPFHDGTISPAAAAGSLPFTPEESKTALLHFYRTVPRLWGRYGFKSSFNLDQGWVAPIYYGIETGTVLCAIDAYKENIVQRTLARNKYIRNALERVGLSPAGQAVEPTP